MTSFRDIRLVVDNAVEKTLTETRNPSLLNGGGGSGTSGGMEARLAVLEDRVETLRSDVGDLKTSMVEVKVGLATLSERVAHLPSKGFVITTTVALMAFITAMVTFQQQVQHFVHGLG